MTQGVTIDIPFDLQQIGGTGFVGTFLDEARDQERIAIRAIVVTSEEVDPVFTRVVALTEGPRRDQGAPRPPPWGP